MKYVLFIFLFIFVLFFNSNTLSSDKLELLNRRIYAFNRGIDKVFLNSCVETYINVVPESLALKINNFFSNLFDVQNLFLNLFLLKFKNFDKILPKVIINSTFGFLGFFDLAEKFNLNVEFISFFNMKSFPIILSKKYIFLPVIGPGLTMYNLNILILQLFNPFFYIVNNLSFFYFIDLINKKSQIYFDSNFFHINFLDGYSFLKDIYFQRFYF